MTKSKYGLGCTMGGCGERGCGPCVGDGDAHFPDPEVKARERKRFGELKNQMKGYADVERGQHGVTITIRRPASFGPEPDPIFQCDDTPKPCADRCPSHEPSDHRCLGCGEVNCLGGCVHG